MKVGGGESKREREREGEDQSKATEMLVGDGVMCDDGVEELAAGVIESTGTEVGAGPDLPNDSLNAGPDSEPNAGPDSEPNAPAEKSGVQEDSVSIGFVEAKASKFAQASVG